MNQIKSAGDFTNQLARDIADLRKAAITAESELRTLKDIEMGWVGGGDGQPVWPY